MSHLISLGVDLTPIQIRFGGHEIKKAAHSKGQICHHILFVHLQTVCDKFAEIRRGEELSVLHLFFRLAVFCVTVKHAALQTMQPPVTGVGVVDVLLGDAGTHSGVAVDQIHYLFIELLPLALRDGFLHRDVLHISTPLKQLAQILFCELVCQRFPGKFYIDSVVFEHFEPLYLLAVEVYLRVPDPAPTQ